MSKTTDDKIEAAITPVVKPMPRVRHIPATVDDDGLAEIERAVTLKLATMCILGRITPELYGKALTGIAQEWSKTEMCRVVRGDKGGEERQGTDRH